MTKASIAEAVLTLTKLEEDHRSPSDCLQTPSLWLTLAALCLLQDEHVERLSSTQWANPRGAVNKVTTPPALIYFRGSLVVRVGQFQSISHLLIILLQFVMERYGTFQLESSRSCDRMKYLLEMSSRSSLMDG